MNNLYTCPKCGANGSIERIVPMMSDMRYDHVACSCGTQWRVYYKIAETTTEVVYMPEDKACDNAEPCNCDREG